MCVWPLIKHTSHILIWAWNTFFSVEPFNLMIRTFYLKLSFVCFAFFFVLIFRFKKHWCQWIHEISKKKKFKTKNRFNDSWGWFCSIRVWSIRPVAKSNIIVTLLWKKIRHLILLTQRLECREKRYIWNEK